MEQKLPTVTSIREGSNTLAMSGVKELFDLSLETLGKLLDPKNPELLQKLGGVNGIADSLHVDVKRGLSTNVDMTELKRAEKYHVRWLCIRVW
jgi:hypothetical protein